MDGQRGHLHTRENSVWRTCRGAQAPGLCCATRGHLRRGGPGTHVSRPGQDRAGRPRGGDGEGHLRPPCRGSDLKAEDPLQAAGPPRARSKWGALLCRRALEVKEGKANSPFVSTAAHNCRQRWTWWQSCPNLEKGSRGASRSMETEGGAYS
jgi:hypothetical protein